jgi:uncharacterized protein (TIGR03067 family)
VRKTCLVLILAATLHAGTLPGDAAKQDRDRLQGVWIGTEVDTKDSSKNEVRVEFKAGKITITAKGRSPSPATYKIDAKKTPATMDMIIKDGDKTAEVLGIYELMGDKLTLCFSATVAAARPKAFEATEDTVLITLRRKQPGK